MRFAPRGRTLGEAVIGGSILVLLVVCCVLLVRSGPWGILLSCVGLGLTAVAWAYTQIISGEWPGVEKLFTSRVCRRRNKSAVQRHAREWDCSEAVAAKLHHLEKQVNEVAGPGMARRLTDLESREAWRTQQEYLELRDVWKVLVRDADTPPEVRRACREWLVKYPETLDFLARLLRDTGLLRERELPDDWEAQEVRKNRIQ